MLFNFMCLLLIVLVTLYLSGQGMLSALLALVTATFASILAMGLMEPLQGIVGGWRPDYGRGVTFLLLFFLAFSACRIGADMVVTKNIKLPTMINRAAGGVLGLLTALVVVGSIVIGLEMMPLGTALLGFDRYRTEAGMDEGRPGELRQASGVWLAPDRFVLGIWNAASGRGLGGSDTRAFGNVHPDLSAESYGYRNTVVYASSHTLPAELLKVNTAWVTGDAKELEGLGIKLLDAGKKVVMVRATVSARGGAKAEISAADADEKYFRVTPLQVRLVTDKGRQYFPIGHLNGGRRFEVLSLNAGHLVDDFAGGVVNEDWVFQINDDEKPELVEVKKARVELAGVLKEKVQPALAAKDYPQRDYQKQGSTVTVTMNVPGGNVVEGRVYVIQGSTFYKDIQTEMANAYSHALEIKQAITDGSSLWSAAGKPGVPPLGTFQSAVQMGINIKNAPDEAPTQWLQVIPILMLTPLTPDGTRNQVVLPNYVKDTLVPLFQKQPRGTAIYASADVNSSGSVQLTNIPPGQMVLFGTCKTEKNFYFWVRDLKVEPKSQQTISLGAGDASEPKVELP